MSNLAISIICFLVAGVCFFLMILPTLIDNHKEKKWRKEIEAKIHNWHTPQRMEFLREHREQQEEKEIMKYHSFCKMMKLEPCSLRNLALYKRVHAKAKAFRARVEL